MPPFPRGLVFPATAAVTLPLFEREKLYALARDIAMGINELHDILNAHGLTPAMYERIREIGAFNRILEAEIEQWHSAKNTPERVRIEAAATFEQLIPTLFARAKVGNENLSSVNDVAKLLAKVAGVDQSDKPIDAGEKFIISIDMGDKTPAINVVHALTPQSGTEQHKNAMTALPKG